MRWKVLILASLAAAIAGAGLPLLMILGLYGSLAELATHDFPSMLTLAIPFLAIGFAGFFVYRHTARRRKLQTVLAVLLTMLFTVAAFALASMLTSGLSLPRVPTASGGK